MPWKTAQNHMLLAAITASPLSDKQLFAGFDMHFAGFEDNALGSPMVSTGNRTRIMSQDDDYALMPMDACMS